MTSFTPTWNGRGERKAGNQNRRNSGRSSGGGFGKVRFNQIYLMKKQPQKLKLPSKFDPETRWLVWYFLVTMLVLWGWQEFFGQVAVRTIPYSQFKAHLERREVFEAAVKQDEIIGRIVPLAARQTNAAPAVPTLNAPETNLVEIPLGLQRALAET